MIRRLGILLIALAFVMTSERAARAQEIDGGTLALSILLNLLSTGSGIGTGYSLWGGCKDCQQSALNEDYLREHYAQLQHDLARGSGGVVDDLAFALRVRPDAVGTLGKLLREERSTLLQLAEPTAVDEGRAAAFVQRVEALVVAHDLREHGPRVTGCAAPPVASTDPPPEPDEPDEPDDGLVLSLAAPAPPLPPIAGQ